MADCMMFAKERGSSSGFLMPKLTVRLGLGKPYTQIESRCSLANAPLLVGKGDHFCLFHNSPFAP